MLNYYCDKLLLNVDLSEKEFIDWFENNKTVLGNKLTTSNDNHWYYWNDELQLDLPFQKRLSDKDPPSERVAVICKELQPHWRDNKYNKMKWCRERCTW
jgi:hypothetical protein